MTTSKNKIEELDEYFKDPHNYSAEITRDEWEKIRSRLR
jgi:hypothetical protein